MPDVSDIINQLKQDAPELVRNNIALAQAEIKPAVKHAGVGTGMFGGAGYVALNAVSLLFMAGGFAFALMYAHLFNWGPLSSAALGFTTMAVVLLIIAAILGLLGKKQIDQIEPPTAAVAEAQATVAALVAAVKRGESPAIAPAGPTTSPVASNPVTSNPVTSPASATTANPVGGQSQPVSVD